MTAFYRAQDKIEEVKKARKEENGAGSEGEEVEEEEAEGIECEDEDEDEDEAELDDDEEIEGEGEEDAIYSHLTFCVLMFVFFFQGMTRRRWRPRRVSTRRRRMHNRDEPEHKSMCELNL